MSGLIVGRATLWSALEIGIRQILQFSVAVVLAHLLTPGDFGVVAILTVFSSLGLAFVQTGLTTAVVQRSSTHEQQSTIFWCGVLLSIAFYLILAALGPPLARYYGIPELRWLILATGLQLICTALAAVQIALLTRDFRFREIAIVSLTGTVISAVVGIVMGFSGWGVWSLVGNLVSFSVVSTAIVWKISDWRPSWTFALSSVSGILRFGGWLSLSGVLDVLYTQGFGLVLGKLYGLHDLGLYSRANNLQTVPGVTINAVVSRITLPYFSNQGADEQALTQSILRVNRLTMLVTLPIAISLGALADLVMFVLFGAQWLGAAPVLTVLAAAGALLPLQITNQQILLARGRSVLYFQVEVVKKLLGVSLLIGGSLYGLMGLAWAQLFASFLGVAVNAYPNGRDIGCGLARQVAGLRSLFVAAAVMATTILALRRVTNFTPAAELILLVAAGASAYVGVCLLLRSAAVFDAARLAVALWRTRSVSVGRSA